MFSSFGQNAGQQQPQQQQQQQPQQQQPAFGSSFGGQQQQQAQQQQQQQQQRPGFGSPMTLNELNRGSQQSYGQPPSMTGGAFGQNQPQAGQTSFGSGGFQQAQQGGASQWGAQNVQQPHQQQQNNPYGSSNSPYGGYQQQQQPHHPQTGAQQPWNASHQFNQPSVFDHQHPQNMTNSAQQQAAQQTYLPGYLSRFRSSRPYSPSASRNNDYSSSSPPRDEHAGAGGQTNSSTTRSSRDDGRRRTSFEGNNDRESGGSGGSLGHQGAPTSPLQGFSSSFFHSSGAGGEGSRSFAGNESIFGAGGLRGGGRGNNRRSLGPSSGLRDTPSGTPARDGRSSSFLRSSSIGSPSSVDGRHHAGDDDDDDAPPCEALADVTSNGGMNAVDDSSFMSATGPSGNQSDPSSRRASIGRSDSIGARRNVNHSNNNNSNAGSMEGSSTLCALLLYGFPSSLRQAVLSHFSSIGEIISHESLSPQTSDDGQSVSDCVRIVYSSAASSLRALRRSGEVVAGVVYVGVRFQDETLHREMLINGLNSIASHSGTSLEQTTATSTANQVTNNKQRESTPHGMTSSTSTARFGRPISIIDSPGAALRPKSQAQPGNISGNNSPFGRLSQFYGGSSNSGAAANAAPNKTTPGANGISNANANGNPGMMGRLGDAIFGW
ncbi:unnamed protein product [Sympodiomycopsis kandeliae]